jgi:hypothetical protein
MRRRFNFALGKRDRVQHGHEGVHRDRYPTEEAVFLALPVGVQTVSSDVFWRRLGKALMIFCQYFLD